MPLQSWILAAAIAVQTSNQDSSASITGLIRTRDGQPVADAVIDAVGLARRAVADRDGRYELRGLPPGTVHLVVRFIGHDRVDTSLSLRPHQRAVWNVTLREAESVRQGLRGESLWVAAGGLDSLAADLVHTDTTSAFTYSSFGIRLLRAAIEGNGADSNCVLSPLSAGQALALALAAAKDSTAIAIAEGLELGTLGWDGIAARSKRFNDALRARRDVTLELANALWVDTSATLQPDFAAWARVRYGASIRSQPLRVPEVVPVLNHWADSTTNHAIPSIRNKPFADSTVVALTNAVYFKGRWREPFDSALTRERPFTTAAGAKITTRTMERTTDLAYRRMPHYQVVRVPYTGGLTSLYIVLPDSGGASAVHLLDDFVRAGWPLPDPRRDSRSVQIRLPRLHVTQATDLRPPFTAIGMGIMFDSTRADFSGLIMPDRRPPPCPPLSSGIRSDFCTRYRINEANQHAFLDVDEKGTEAAAVTTLGFEVRGITASPPPIQFFLDRPFLFALRDERTGTMLFVGYIATPRQ